MSIFQEPASHSYLGDNLEDIKNRSILEIHGVYEVLLIPMHDVILFPNETLPLRIQSPNFIAQIRKLFDFKTDVYGNIKEEVHHLGILNYSATRHGGVQVAKVGTTIEVRTKSKETLQANGNNDEIILTSKGRHRFKVLSTRRVDHVTFGKVQILEEESSCNVHLLKRLNSFPQWVYECNKPASLAFEAYKLFINSLVLQDSNHQQILSRWGPVTASEPSNDKVSCGSSSSAGYPRPFYGAELDPVGFSFYLSANLSLALDDLQRLLEAQDVTDRLRLAIQFLKENAQKQMGCGVCRQPLAAKHEVFSLPGAEGMVGAYVNPHGAVHQTVTVRRLVQGHPVQLEGRPSTQDSWFPGYAWTIAYCGRCFNHLGWRFTIVGSDHTENDEDDDSDFSGDRDVLDDDEDDDADNQRSESDVAQEEDDLEEEDSSYEISVEGDRDPLASSSSSEMGNNEDDDSGDSSGGSDEPEEGPVSPVVSLTRPDGRVIEFWGLRRAALKEV